MLRYLHGIENIKDRICKYFTYIFLSQQKDQLKFYDGHKLLKFSARPTIIKKGAWDFRTLPCLLIGASTGELECISIEKDFLGNTSTYTIPTDDMPGPSGTDFQESGGEISLNISIDIYAYTAEERDKLLDISSVYLSNPTAKDYFMKHYIRIPNNIRVSEGSAINLPNIDTPVYYSTLSCVFYGAWRDREYCGERLSEMLFDLEFRKNLNFYLDHAAAVDYSTVRLVFSEDLADNVNLYNIDHYTFACPTVITATEITLVNSTTIDITIDGEMQDGGSYLVKVTDIQNYDNKTIKAKDGQAVFRGLGILPRVDSATVLDYSTILVTFTRDMKNNADLIDIDNYVFTGATALTPNLITRLSDTTVSVAFTEEMLDGGTYTITVSNVVDSIGNRIDPAYSSGTFVGVGIIPTVSNVTATDAYTIRTTFSEAMSDTGLTTDSNYVFTCPVGAVITVDSVTKINSTTVDITIVGEMLTGTDNYTLTVNNVTDLVGNPIDPTSNSDTFSGIGIAPQVSSATSVDSTTIRVVFTEDMNDLGLTTNGNYAFTCPPSAPISVLSVARTIGTQDSVDVSISGEMLTGIDNYTLTISNVIDTVGNVLDPAHDSDTFNGIGIAPQVLSASFVDADTCTVTFDSSMDITSAQVPGNYVLSGPSSPVVSTATLVGNTVTLDLATNMLNGDYTVTVSNVTDLVGNVIDPAHNSGTYTASVSAFYIMIFGGDPYNNETWECAGVDWELKNPAISPSVRSWQPSVYDSNRHKAVLFGGRDAAAVVNDETWEWDGTDWVQKASGAVPKPTARCGHSMTYDLSSNNVVLFGGIGLSYYQDTWEWDGVNWELKNPITKPEARHSAAMAYDSNRGVTVLFGGYPLSGVTNETWEYNGTNWELKNPIARPTVRRFHAMAYDFNRNVIVLFGGLSPSTGYNDETWEYDGSTWTQRFPINKPSRRYWHTMTYYNKYNSVFLFGGLDSTSTNKNDLWKWTGTNWELIAVNVPIPSGRKAHSMALSWH